MNTLAQHPAWKSRLDAQVSLLADVAGKVYDALHRITELNLRLAQQLADDAMASSRQMIGTSGPVECCAAMLAGSVPASGHLRAYQQELMNVLAGTQFELSRTADTRIPEANRAAGALADDMVRRSTQAGERMAAEQRNAFERMSFPPAPDGPATESRAQ